MSLEPTLRVAQVNFHPDVEGRPAAALLQAWPTLAVVAEAVAATGAEVTVLQASPRRETARIAGVTYRLAPVADFDPWLKPEAIDVVHVHGLSFLREVRALHARHPGLPLLLQDHANAPPPGWWRRRAWRPALKAAAATVFCAAEQARPFIDAGLLPRDAALIEIPESSSRFVPGDRAAARASTGLAGDPVLLWVGHLNANKDPLTVLEAVAQVLPDLPALQLYCCFGDAPLRPAVQARLAADAQLAGHVHLLGRVPHAQVQTLMQAADFLVLGSHREGCNYATIEALACGLPPLVTDLPSMRRLTGDGAAGALWPPGNAAALAALLLRLAPADRGPLRQAARAQFEHTLAPEPLGRRWRAAYRQCIVKAPKSGAASR